MSKLFVYIPHHDAAPPPPPPEEEVKTYYCYDPTNAGRLTEADNNFYFGARGPNVPKPAVPAPFSYVPYYVLLSLPRHL